jgi:hypothetical protein
VAGSGGCGTRDPAQPQGAFHYGYAENAVVRNRRLEAGMFVVTKLPDGVIGGPDL